MSAARVNANARMAKVRLNALSGHVDLRRLLLVMMLRFVETTIVGGASMSGSLRVGTLRAFDAAEETLSNTSSH